MLNFIIGFLTSTVIMFLILGIVVYNLYKKFYSIRNNSYLGNLFKEDNSLKEDKNIVECIEDEESFKDFFSS